MRRCARRRGARGGGGAHAFGAPRAGDARAGGVSARGRPHLLSAMRHRTKAARARGRPAHPARTRARDRLLAELAARGRSARTNCTTAGAPAGLGRGDAGESDAAKNFFFTARADRAARLAAAALRLPSACCPPRARRAGTPGAETARCSHAPQAPPAPVALLKRDELRPCEDFVQPSSSTACPRVRRARRSTACARTHRCFPQSKIKNPKSKIPPRRCSSRPSIRSFTIGA